MDRSLLRSANTATRTTTILKRANVRDEHMELIKQTLFGQLVDGVGIFFHTSLLDELVEFWAKDEQGFILHNTLIPFRRSD